MLKTIIFSGLALFLAMLAVGLVIAHMAAGIGG